MNLLSRHRRGLLERVVLYRHLVAELAGVQPVIVPPGAQQFGVRAHLRDAPVLDDQDAVGRLDGARAGGR